MCLRLRGEPSKTPETSRKEKKNEWTEAQAITNEQKQLKYCCHSCRVYRKETSRPSLFAFKFSRDTLSIGVLFVLIISLLFDKINKERKHTKLTLSRTRVYVCIYINRRPRPELDETLHPTCGCPSRSQLTTCTVE